MDSGREDWLALRSMKSDYVTVERSGEIHDPEVRELGRLNLHGLQSLGKTARGEQQLRVNRTRREATDIHGGVG